MIPRNEMEVVVLFSQQAQLAGFEIVSVQAGFPDAIIRRGEIEYKVEFEYKSSNFWAHKHNPTMCDLVICWLDDDEYPVLPIIALSDPDWINTEIVSPPHQERLVGYWKTRALSAERKLEEAEKKIEEARRSGELVDFPIPEETKAELDTLLEEAIKEATRLTGSRHVDNYQLAFVFGEFIEGKLKEKPASVESLYFRAYTRQLTRLILAS